ncbi:MAG TPA: hypothetical protein VMZ05_01355 [Spirochaetota bacterium]|nr:hypothetical protein [Spirochaetota bacterium]
MRTFIEPEIVLRALQNAIETEISEIGEILQRMMLEINENGDYSTD